MPASRLKKPLERKKSSFRGLFSKKRISHERSTRCKAYSESRGISLRSKPLHNWPLCGGLGAPLLGVDGIAIVGHGRSDAKAVRNGIRVAAQAVENGVLEAIKQGLAGYEAPPETVSE